MSIPFLRSRTGPAVMATGVLAFASACTDVQPPWAQSSTSSSSGTAPQFQDADLPAPPEGQGFHFETEAFEVPQGVEQQDCYFFQVPGTAGQDVYINKIEVVQNEGSHHMNIFRVRTIPDTADNLDPAKGLVQKAQDGQGPCFKSANWADWPLVMNSQVDEKIDWTLPTGVAHKFQAGEWMMLQTHYVNAATQTTPFRGHVEVNFWSIPQDQVTSELGTIFATKQSIRICQSNPEPTFEGSCQFNSTEQTTIVGANAHFHSRGKKFDMWGWDGTSATTPPESEKFYSSEDWEEPPMSRSPELSKVIPPGGGVWYSCSYEWQEPAGSVTCESLNQIDSQPHAGQPATPADELDCCYTFGGVVDRGEHCNIFVYYYPKSDDVNCF
ncbi:MAG: hypothetical protein AB2A00_10110 [Myxococcota bacterium]